MEQLKTCSKCGLEKALSYFYQRAGKSVAQCKLCHNAAARRNAVANQEAIAARNKATYESSALFKERQERKHILEQQRRAPEKICTWCGKTKSIDAFGQYQTPKGNTAHRAFCSVCQNTDQKQRRAANPEHTKKLAKRSYDKNAQQRRAASREWRCKHLERAKAALAEWRRKNKNHLTDYHRRKYRENKEQHRLWRRSDYYKHRKKRLASRKQYRERNLERLQALNREYHRKNRERLLKQHREYYRTNKHRLKHADITGADYARALLLRREPILRATDIPQSLIELKRVQLQITRTIRKVKK